MNGTQQETAQSETQPSVGVSHDIIAADTNAGGENSPLLTHSATFPFGHENLQQDETRRQSQSNSSFEEDPERHSDSSSSSGEYHSSVEDEDSSHRKKSGRENRTPADPIDHPLVNSEQSVLLQEGAPASQRPSPSVRSNQSFDGSNTSHTLSSSSQHRRRRRTATTTTTPSISSCTNSSSASSLRPSNTRMQQSRRGLRASLDTGMAAVRRRIRSRDSSSRRSNQSSTTASLGEQDLFALTMNGEDPRMYHHPTILEEEDVDDLVRQRSASEPDALWIRDFLFHAGRRSTQRRRRSRAESEEISHNGRMLLSSSAAAALNSTTPTTTSIRNGRAVDLMSSTASSNVPAHGTNSSFRERSTTTDNSTAAENANIHHMTATILPGDTTRMNSNPQESASGSESGNIDPERQARIRWIQINRRFQLVITIVALLFSLLLFSILICWVVLTSAYVVSFDKSCDVPLKPYFWLVTLQLVLDVFRSDIMRFIFHWDANANQRSPCRVIAYNLAYLLYALLVLRLGVRSVFVEEDTTCRTTAPELFNTSVAFVSLSLAAWTTIVCGYLLPFCIVAALLTYNGYNPSSSTRQTETGATQPVFPAAYSTTGAPTGCVDLLRVLSIDEFPADYPRECCICMEEFDGDDLVVETACKHVFHKQCCREWLRQARTCPVCRTDIPSTLEGMRESNEGAPGRQVNPRIPLGPTGRPVAGLIRILQSRSDSAVSASPPSNGTNSASRAASPTMVEMSPSDLEEGRTNQHFHR